MKLALAVVLMILATGPVAAGDNTGAILGGIGSFADSLARSMAEARKEAMEQERLRLERQRLDQELGYQRAVLEQNQRQFDAQMAAQREQRALFDTARRRAAEEADQKARGPVPKNTAELAALEPSIAALAHKLVALCVDEVRAQDPRSGFDAYIHVEKVVQMWGTKEQYFKFEKCLHMRAPALLESASKP
jgi:hypothetical protein